jgi:hypothetical protein
MAKSSQVTLYKENGGGCSYCDFRSDDGRISYSMISGPDGVAVDDYREYAASACWVRVCHPHDFACGTLLLREPFEVPYLLCTASMLGNDSACGASARSLGVVTDALRLGASVSLCVLRVLPAEALIDVGWGRMGNRVTKPVNERGAPWIARALVLLGCRVFHIRYALICCPLLPVDRDLARTNFCVSTACCPNYNIRCDVNGFVPSSSQVAVLKLFRRYFAGGGGGGGEGGAPAGMDMVGGDGGGEGGGGAAGGGGGGGPARPAGTRDAPVAALHPGLALRMRTAVLHAVALARAARGTGEPTVAGSAEEEGWSIGLRAAPPRVVAALDVPQHAVASTAVAFALAAKVRGGRACARARVLRWRARALVVVIVVFMS